VIAVSKGFIAVLALMLGLHAGIGCGVVQATAAVEAPCCGQNCPMGSAVGQSACCHAQDAGAAAQEISKPSLPIAQFLVGLIRLTDVSPARTVIEQASRFQSSPAGIQLALLCSRQI